MSAPMFKGGNALPALMTLSNLRLRDQVRPMQGLNLHGEPAPNLDRRAAQRIRQPFRAEIAPWHGKHTGPVFGVLIQDISTTGLRLHHSAELKVGGKYLLEIPRLGQPPIGVVFSVVHCDENASGGRFSVELEPDDVLDLTTRVALLQYSQPERAPNTVIAAVLTSVIAAAVTLYFLLAN